MLALRSKAIVVWGRKQLSPPKGDFISSCNLWRSINPAPGVTAFAHAKLGGNGCCRDQTRQEILFIEEKFYVVCISRGARALRQLMMLIDVDWWLMLIDDNDVDVATKSYTCWSTNVKSVRSAFFPFWTLHKGQKVPPVWGGKKCTFLHAHSEFSRFLTIKNTFFVWKMTLLGGVPPLSPRPRKCSRSPLHF